MSSRNQGTLCALSVLLCVVSVQAVAVTDGLWGMGWPMSDSFSLMYFDPSKGDFTAAVSTDLSLSFPGTCFIYIPETQQFHGTVELQDTETAYVKFNPSDSTWEKIKPQYNLATCEHDPDTKTTYVTWFGVTNGDSTQYAVRFGTLNTTSGEVKPVKDYPSLYQNYTSLGKSAYDVKNKLYYILLGSDVFGHAIGQINLKTLEVTVSPPCPSCAIQDLKVSQSNSALLVTRMSPEKYNNVTGSYTYDIVEWTMAGGLGNQVGYLYKTVPSNGTGFYNGFHNTGYDWVNEKYYANLGPYLLVAPINASNPNAPAQPYPINSGVNNMRYVSMTKFSSDVRDNAVLVHRLRGGVRERRTEFARSDVSSTDRLRGGTSVRWLDPDERASRPKTKVTQVIPK